MICHTDKFIYPKGVNAYLSGLVYRHIYLGFIYFKSFVFHNFVLSMNTKTHLVFTTQITVKFWFQISLTANFTSFLGFKPYLPRIATF